MDLFCCIKYCHTLKCRHRFYKLIIPVVFVFKHTKRGERGTKENYVSGFSCIERIAHRISSDLIYQVTCCGNFLFNPFGVGAGHNKNDVFLCTVAKRTQCRNGRLGSCCVIVVIDLYPVFFRKELQPPFYTLKRRNGLVYHVCVNAKRSCGGNGEPRVVAVMFARQLKFPLLGKILAVCNKSMRRDFLLIAVLFYKRRYLPT